MEAIEIVLLVAGGIIFILSFLIPARGEKLKGASAPMAQDEIRSMVDRELEAVKGHMDEVVEEAVTYAMEKTERSLERLSNEKIMAINEYSDTVLSEIHKNHEEAVFLYDMLNSKHANLKDTVSEVTRTVKEAEEAMSTFQKLTPERVSDPESRAAVGRTDEEPSHMAAFARAVPEPSPKVVVQKAAPEPSPKAAFVRAAEEQMAQASKETKQQILSDGLRVALAELEASGNSNDRIRELYNRGMDKVAIARELGLGVGEVKLVIDLFEGNEMR